MAATQYLLTFERSGGLNDVLGVYTGSLRFELRAECGARPKVAGLPSS